jgi:hypothetical protein
VRLTTGRVTASSSISFEVYDFAFRLRSNVPETRRAFKRLYGGFRKPVPDASTLDADFNTDGSGKFVWQVGEKDGSEAALVPALWAFEAALCEQMLLSQAGRVAIHGVGVYSRSSAAVIVGRSGAGKSTLSLALARRGFAVASDDVMLVDPATLHLLPVPRCYHLDANSVAILEADKFRFPRAWQDFHFLVPADLGVRAVPERTARYLILLSGPRGEDPRLEPISQAEMVAQILAETGRAQLRDSDVIGVLARMAGAAGCYRLFPGQLSATADMLADLLNSEPAECGARISA